MDLNGSQWEFNQWIPSSDKRPHSPMWGRKGMVCCICPALQHVLNRPAWKTGRCRTCRDGLRCICISPSHSQWISMDLNGSQWISMGIQWTFLYRYWPWQFHWESQWSVCMCNSWSTCAMALQPSVGCSIWSLSATITTHSPIEHFQKNLNESQWVLNGNLVTEVLAAVFNVGFAFRKSESSANYRS